MGGSPPPANSTSTSLLNCHKRCKSSLVMARKSVFCPLNISDTVLLMLRNLSQHATVCGLPHTLFMGYPLVDGTRQRRFDGTNLKPRKQPENVVTPKTVAARCVGQLYLYTAFYVLE